MSEIRHYRDRDGEPYRCWQHPKLYFNNVDDYNLHRMIDHDGTLLIDPYKGNEAHNARMSRFFGGG